MKKEDFKKIVPLKKEDISRPIEELSEKELESLQYDVQDMW